MWFIANIFGSIFLGMMVTLQKKNPEKKKKKKEYIGC
jgi:fluoride ion exporter CrcB/FEX